MTSRLHIYRSNKTERLFDQLVSEVFTNSSRDPFVETPIVVGSKGMERWLRYEIAREKGISSGFDFPFLRTALDATVQCLSTNEGSLPGKFWQNQQGHIFDRKNLTFRIVAIVMSPEYLQRFSTIKQYLSDSTKSSGDCIGSRELQFCDEVAGVVCRHLTERPLDCLAWARDPDSVELEFQWLSVLYQKLEVHSHHLSPVFTVEELRAKKPRNHHRSMYFFGVSLFSKSDLERIYLISRFVDCHVFILCPTDVWIGDMRSKRESSRIELLEVESRASNYAPNNDLIHNPILENLGKPSRDLQGLIEELVDYEDHPLFESVSQTDSIFSLRSPFLGSIQEWILAAKAQPEVLDIAEISSKGVSFFSTFGPTRQCEVLKDQLLNAFNNDDTLKPKDILIMTPDIETFGPLVYATFARTFQREDSYSSIPSIPVTIADMGLRSTNPIAEVILALLQLPDARITSESMLELLSTPFISKKWELSHDDILVVNQLFIQTNFRWGLDADDKGAVNQPEIHQNSLDFAMERLIAGVFYEDNQVIEVPQGYSIASIDIVSLERQILVGKLLDFIQTVRHFRNELSSPCTLLEWRQRIDLVIENFTTQDAKEAIFSLDIQRTLSEWSQDTESTLLTCNAIYRFLLGQFEIRVGGDRHINGAVQVCSLEPMRTVPFRIVVLLGMDDGAFPKVEIRKQWDPMLQLRKGELDKQQIDRHLFLEALLSTRDQFWVLWSGRNVRSGDETPPCTPVNELIQVLQENYSNPPIHISEFPLQPWTLKNFVQFNFGPQFTENPLETEPNLSTFSNLSKRTPSEEKKNVSVHTIPELTRVILKPYRFFFNKAMNIRLPYEEKEGQIREPLSLGGLESWSIKSELLNRHLISPLQTTVSNTDFESHFRLLGDLPLGGAGVLQLETISDAIVPTVDLINQYSHFLLEPLELRCPLSNGDILVCTVSRLYETERGLILQWVSPSKTPSNRLLMESWLSMMMALQAGHTVLCAEIVCIKDSKISSHRLRGTNLDSDFAKEYLETMYGILKESTCRFLPIFPNTSSAIGKELSSNEDFILNSTQIPTQILRPIIDKEWDFIDSGEGKSDKDWEDPYLKYFCFEYSPLGNFSNHIDDNECVSWALKIWQPIFKSVGEIQKTLAIIDEEL